MQSLLRSDEFRRVWHRLGSYIMLVTHRWIPKSDVTGQIINLFVCRVLHIQCQKRITCIESFNCWFTDLSTTTTYREHFSWWDRYNSSDSTLFPSSYFIGFDGLMWCDVQVQEKLRLDLRRKIEALDIDQTCFSLDNRSLLCPIYFTIGCSGSVANMFVANCTLYQSSYDLLCTLIKIHVSNVFFPALTKSSCTQEFTRQTFAPATRRQDFYMSELTK